MPLSSFAIGISMETITNIEQLATPLPVPRSPFSPYGAYTTMANGLKRGRGFPALSWIFSLLTPAQRTQLRVFCPGSSATVYIRTPINDGDTYAYFQAVMHWPEKEVRDPTRVHHRLEMEFSFTRLILEPDPVEE